MHYLIAINYVYVYGRKHAVEFSIIKIVKSLAHVIRVQKI